jgi:transposase InsO family protein
MSRLPASRRYKRHMERWKCPARASGPGRREVRGADRRTRKKHYQFTAIDDCTRLRALSVYHHLNQKTAIQFIDYVFEKLPFRVEVIQTDNGAEFQAAFHWRILDSGAQHVYIKPATPQPNGKVERSHRIDADEFWLLNGVVLDDARLLTTKLQEWEDFSDFDRPHGGLGGQTPYKRLRQKTGALV